MPAVSVPPLFFRGVGAGQGWGRPGGPNWCYDSGGGRMEGHG